MAAATLIDRPILAFAMACCCLPLSHPKHSIRPIHLCCLSLFYCNLQVHQLECCECMRLPSRFPGPPNQRGPELSNAALCYAVLPEVFVIDEQVTMFHVAWCSRRRGRKPKLAQGRSYTCQFWQHSKAPVLHRWLRTM